MEVEGSLKRMDLTLVVLKVEVAGDLAEIDPILLRLSLVKMIASIDYFLTSYLFISTVP
jgi:hypothetical protein